ncbi:MAG: SAV_915 family protein [Pseudonocardiaceae bacterium]
MSEQIFAGMPQVPMPGHVYVPVAEVDAEMTETRFEGRQLPGGEVAALAYSTLEELVARTGEQQPWILLPSERLLALQQQLGFDRVVLDLEVPEEQRHGATEEDGRHGRG